MLCDVIFCDTRALYCRTLRRSLLSGTLYGHYRLGTIVWAQSSGHYRLGTIRSTTFMDTGTSNDSARQQLQNHVDIRIRATGTFSPLGRYTASL